MTKNPCSDIQFPIFKGNKWWLFEDFSATTFISDRAAVGCQSNLFLFSQGGRVSGQMAIARTQGLAWTLIKGQYHAIFSTTLKIEKTLFG